MNMLYVVSYGILYVSYTICITTRRHLYSDCIHTDCILSFSSLSLLLLFSPQWRHFKIPTNVCWHSCENYYLHTFALDQSDGTIFALDQSRLILQESADCMALHAFSSNLASRSTTTSLMTATGSAAGGRKSLAVSSAGGQAASTASKFQQHHYGDKGTVMGYSNMGNMHNQFKSSSSQTTFLDRNIVQNLALTRPGSSQAGGGPFDQQGPQSSSSKLSSVGGRTTATVATGAGGGGHAGAARRRCRPKTVPASYTSGSGSVKRASFSGTLPDGKQNS